MARFFLRQAGEADNAALCALAEIPIAGSISLALERRPDFFAGAAVQNEAVEVHVVCDRRHGGQVAAAFSTGRRRAFVDGRPAWVRYLSDVRIASEYRGGTLLRSINDCIVAREQDQPSAAMQGVMFADNAALLGVIRRRRSRALLERFAYLRFEELGTYRTSAVSLDGGRRRHTFRYDVRRASTADIHAMQAFFDAQAPAKQLYPVCIFDRLGDPWYRGLAIEDYFLAFDAGQLAGITGIWDQRAFRQTRIVGYGGGLRLARPLLNAVGRIATHLTLPPPGTLLSSFYLHTIVTRGNSPEIFRDLVEHIHASYRRSEFAWFLCGLFMHDPLIGAIDRFRSRRDVFARHCLIHSNAAARSLQPDAPVYLEAARI